MSSNVLSYLIPEDIKIAELNERTIKLAKYLKMLDDEQERKMLIMKEVLTFNQVMEIVNIANPVTRTERIKYKMQEFGFDKQI